MPTFDDHFARAADEARRTAAADDAERHQAQSTLTGTRGVAQPIIARACSDAVARLKAEGVPPHRLGQWDLPSVEILDAAASGFPVALYTPAENSTWIRKKWTFSWRGPTWATLTVDRQLLANGWKATGQRGRTSENIARTDALYSSIEVVDIESIARHRIAGEYGRSHTLALDQASQELYLYAGKEGQTPVIATLLEYSARCVLHMANAWHNRPR